MGIIISLVAPTVSNNISSRILLGPEKTEKNQNTSDDVSKFDNITSPSSSELGPSPENKPSSNPILGAPVIRPPHDTISKAPDNSIYDTLLMTPEVDWSKKMMMKSSNKISNK